MNFIQLLKIDGVDVNIALMMTKALFGKLKVLKNVGESELLRALKQVVESEHNPKFSISEKEIKEIITNIKTVEEI